MEFHENLHDLAVKEGLKGRKLHKAEESFTWNITILKVSSCVTKQPPRPSFCCSPCHISRRKLMCNFVDLSLRLVQTKALLHEVQPDKNAISKT